MDVIYTASRSPWRMAMLFAGALAFVVLGAWMAGLIGTAPPDAPFWLGWVSILFFGGMGAFIATRLFDRGEVLRINAEGIWWRDHADIVIPWSEIAAYGEMAMGRQRMIALQLHDPAAYPASGIAAALASGNRAMTGADIVIALTGTTGNIDQAMAAMLHHMPPPV